MKASWVILVAAVLSFGQTTTKKATSATTKSDNWQRSKECASQAEKVMRDKPGAWANHYSPKYERCFIRVTESVPGDDKVSTLYKYDLIDAFERTLLATLTLGGGPGRQHIDPDFSCQIDDQPVACAKASSFISEHMKN
jgi:hypothetical protein